MKKTIIILILSAFFIFNLNAQIITKDGLPALPVSSGNKEAYSFVDGTIEFVEYKSTGFAVAIKTIQIYFFNGKEQSLEYILVIGDLQKAYVQKGKAVKKGDLIGFSGDNSYITAYVKELDPFMVRTMIAKPVFYKKNWYFAPEWIIPNRFHWLKYYPIDSFELKISDYIKRLTADKDHGLLVIDHNFKDDHMKIKVKLQQYPVEINHVAVKNSVELMIYNKLDLFTAEIPYCTVEGFTVKFYWRKDFDNYLKKEYELNTDIYLYCDIYGIDFTNKIIGIFIYEFSIIDDPEVINGQIKKILNDIK